MKIIQHFRVDFQRRSRIFFLLVLDSEVVHKLCKKRENNRSIRVKRVDVIHRVELDDGIDEITQGLITRIDRICDGVLDGIEVRLLLPLLIQSRTG